MKHCKNLKVIIFHEKPVYKVGFTIFFELSAISIDVLI